MTEKITKTQSVLEVLDRIKLMVESEERNIDLWAGVIDDLLDDMQEMHVFGEGAKGDPRGDFRVKDWELSSNKIQR